MGGMNAGAYTLYDKRMSLYSPGGPVAQQLARSNIVIVVNDSCFVHVLMPRHGTSSVIRLQSWVARARLRNRAFKYIDYGPKSLSTLITVPSSGFI